MQAKAAIPFPSHAQAAQLAKLDELQARLDDARLRVAALGQFKRGKSTLLNALLGAPILPMGVTPVTAIPTFIRAGEALSVRIALKDERGTVVAGVGDEALRLLEQFTSEAQNPHNRRRVATVTIEAPSDFLAEGMILIDTPGVGSTFQHNTTAAEFGSRRVRRGALRPVGRPADHGSRNRLSRESPKIGPADLLCFEQGGLAR